MKSIRIAQANALRGESGYVETDQDILEHMNPRGLGSAGYCVIEGIKVFPRGRAKEILDYEAESPSDREARGMRERDAAAKAAAQPEGPTAA